MKSKANVISKGEYNVSLDRDSLYKSVVIIPIIIIIIGNLLFRILTAQAVPLHFDSLVASKKALKMM